MSRAEELKALLASDNRLNFQEVRTSTDVLRGKEMVQRVLWYSGTLVLVRAKKRDRDGSFFVLV